MQLLEEGSLKCLQSKILKKPTGQKITDMQTFTIRIYDLHQHPVTKFHDANEILMTMCCAKEGIVIGTSLLKLDPKKTICLHFHLMLAESLDQSYLQINERLRKFRFPFVHRLACPCDDLH